MCVEVSNLVSNGIEDFVVGLSIPQLEELTAAHAKLKEEGITASDERGAYRANMHTHMQTLMLVGTHALPPTLHGRHGGRGMPGM